MIEIKPEPIYCTQCSKPVDESDPLEFGEFSLACESCIRTYYQESYAEILSFSKHSKRDFEAFIQEELGFRRKSGARVLKGILRQRAKEQRKQERQWRY